MSSNEKEHAKQNMDVAYCENVSCERQTAVTMIDAMSSNKVAPLLLLTQAFSVMLQKVANANAGLRLRMCMVSCVGDYG